MSKQNRRKKKKTAIRQSTAQPAASGASSSTGEENAAPGTPDDNPKKPDKPSSDTPQKEQGNANAPKEKNDKEPKGEQSDPPPKKKLSKKKVAGIVALCLVAVLAVGLFSVYNVLSSQINGENTEAGTLPQEVKTLPEYTGNGVLTMLICGIDYDNEDADGFVDEDDHIGRTDMILYMMYDTVENKVNFLQIPRDTYVGEDVETGGTGKINGLYYYSPDPDNRMAALATVISEQFGLPVDYYLTIDMDAVKEIIDIKGTISVYVPVEVSDPQSPDAVIPPGWRDFTSTEAEFFLRNRTSPTYGQQGDIMRLQMQQSFYSALFREFKQLAPADLLMWMEVLLWRCNTDMDPVEIGGVAQKALKLQSSGITFLRPPVSGAKLGNVSLVSLVPDETANLLNEYFEPVRGILTVDELDIHTLPVDPNIGVSEATIRTMADVQATEAA